MATPYGPAADTMNNNTADMIMLATCRCSWFARPNITTARPIAGQTMSGWYGSRQAGSAYT